MYIYYLYVYTSMRTMLIYFDRFGIERGRECYLYTNMPQRRGMSLV